MMTQNKPKFKISSVGYLCRGDKVLVDLRGVSSSEAQFLLRTCQQSDELLAEIKQAYQDCISIGEDLGAQDYKSIISRLGNMEIAFKRVIARAVNGLERSEEQGGE